MTERMQQVLDNLRRQIGDSQWDDFVEACYDAFGNHDELDGENAVLFEQVQVLKRENNELKMKFIAANRKSIDLEHEVADLKAENNKLRDLARKLYGGYMISCNGCEYAYEDDGGYTPLDPDCCVFSFSDRYVGCWKRKRLEAEMCELGVEVDG